MAKKNAKENLQDLSLEELTDRIDDAKLRLKKMKFAHAIQPLENPMQIRETKKEVARLMTALSNHNTEESQA